MTARGSTARRLRAPTAGRYALANADSACGDVSSAGRHVLRSGLTTRPIRIALAETLIRQILPSTTARTRWMFGLNFRLVIPVTFLPIPPRYFALPRREMLLPERVFFPVK